LADNPIVVISADAFEGSPRLQTIDLSHSISFAGLASAAIPDDTFSGLPSLSAINYLSSACHAGFGAGFSSSGLEMCLRCPTGTHKPSGAGSLLACEPCPAGTTDADMDPVTPCSECGPGNFTALGTTGACTAHMCPAGTTDHDADAATVCEPCPLGTHTANGFFGSLCPRCAEGETDHDNSSATPCVRCASSGGVPVNAIGPCLPAAVAAVNTRASATVAIVLGTVSVLLLLIGVLVRTCPLRLPQMAGVPAHLCTPSPICCCPLHFTPCMFVVSYTFPRSTSLPPLLPQDRTRVAAPHRTGT